MTDDWRLRWIETDDGVRFYVRCNACPDRPEYDLDELRRDGHLSRYATGGQDSAVEAYCPECGTAMWSRVDYPPLDLGLIRRED